MRRLPPEVCPSCGARESYVARYTVGGGWRIAHYQCTECGRVHRHLEPRRRPGDGESSEE
jgi:uncharacterized Zn finger protein